MRDREFYYLRLDARQFYGKRVFDSLPKKEQQIIESKIREIYQKFDKRIKAEGISMAGLSAYTEIKVGK